MGYTYVFHCPVHGPEIQVACFRAFQEENKHLWIKYEVISRAVEFSDSERDTFLSNLSKLIDSEGVR